MTEAGLRYDNLRALFINGTLKPSPEPSNTGGLIDRSRAIMEKQGIHVDVVRAIDHEIATGVWPDMTEHGWEHDAWPALYRQVLAADILVLAGPIWLGDNSSMTKQVIERLYACSSDLNGAHHPPAGRRRLDRRGRSYLDPGSGGPENDFTNRNTTFMTWNLLHLAAMLKAAGGIPAHGNQRSEWDAGSRFDFPNPEYR
jgi:multimeric flavodoxin WrbA